MIKNTDLNVIVIDRQRYQELLGLANDAAKEFGLEAKVEKIEKHVTKFNEGMPPDIADRNYKRVLRQQITAKKFRELCRKPKNAQTFYVTGRWEKRDLYIPVQIVGRGKLSLTHAYRTMVVTPVQVTDKFITALRYAPRYRDHTAHMAATPLAWIRPVEEAVIHFNWTQRSHSRSDKEDTRYLFHVNFQHLLEELPEGVTQVPLDTHHGTVGYIFAGCYVGPIADRINALPPKE